MPPLFPQLDFSLLKTACGIWKVMDIWKYGHRLHLSIAVGFDSIPTVIADPI
jgi:hypothetical protein